MDQTEAELESFRQKWREEVNARKAPTRTRPTSTQASSTAPSKAAQQPTPGLAAPSAALAQYTTARKQEEGWNEIEPRTYHDIEPRQTGHRLGDETSAPVQPAAPKSALDHYEDAVANENLGKLGESVKSYRQAFKLDDRVHEAYKNKHFPASSFPPKPKAARSETSHARTTSGNAPTNPLGGLPPTLSELLSDFSQLSIEGEEPPTDLSPPPPCPIATLPEELLAEILVQVAIDDVATLSRLALVCKRLAYLVLTEGRVWRRVSEGIEFGFGAMHYAWAREIDGNPVFSEDSQGTLEKIEPKPVSLGHLVPAAYPNYRYMFRHRPRIRFNGCYISTVNYTRAGAASTDSATWGTPIHIVTYFRYLRFFRDGSVISLLTTAEPADVVHHLWPEHIHARHGPTAPEKAMKDALRGRWKLSGLTDNTDNAEDSNEPEGTLTVETDGSVPKYMFRMCLSIGSAGRGARNNKLSWQGYWSYNKTSDDWAEFGLRHDKPFYWSRVKSYGIGLRDTRPAA